MMAYHMSWAVMKGKRVVSKHKTYERAERAYESCVRGAWKDVPEAIKKRKREDSLYIAPHWNDFRIEKLPEPVRTRIPF